MKRDHADTSNIMSVSKTYKIDRKKIVTIMLESGKNVCD